MKRLTHRNEDGMVFLNGSVTIRTYEEAIDRLAYYEDMEEQGRLVVLPCKVGDTVYEICNNTNACHKCPHYEGIYGSGESWCMQIDDDDLRYYPQVAEKPLCEKQFMEVVAHTPNLDWLFHHRNEFGKTVFLTREEAEDALKGGPKE